MNKAGQRQLALALLIPVGLLILILWAMTSPSDGSGRAHFPEDTSSSLATAAVVLVFLGTFTALALNLIHRLTAVVIGAAVCLLLGTLLRSYSPSDAFLYLWGKVDVLILLGGISIVTGLLQESGLFGRLAGKMVHVSGGSQWKVMALFCLLTFGLSMFINNLATILVLVPISLRVAKAMKMDPVPLVLGEIIASNLGGASTMVGDFPNILIATETGLPFHEFLLHLAPVCFLQLGVLILFLPPKFSDRQMESSRRMDLLRQLRLESWDRSMANRGLVILGLIIAGFMICGWYDVPVAFVAGSGAILALLFGQVPWRRLIGRMCLDDILFFACLFLMVGAVNATGLLDSLGLEIDNLWRRSPVWGGIALAWGAALLTCILNAGPTTALLIHVLLAGLGGFTPGAEMWWALSLGVCAGSSATLTGATAGPVTAGLLEKAGFSLTYKRFADTGIPLMFVFLLISSSYLALMIPLCQPG
ncbi:MAG: ArsB/NhaD family transporter [Planctomycetota bacterium]|jgi:Na+/H+ antiporter NhaD/arsenite permease-like protein